MAEVQPRADTVVTPCIQRCELDAAQYCIGCGRSAEEITHWLSYSDEARLQIMQRLAHFRFQ